MINLLPTDIKSNYSYGKRNVTLRRWVVAFIAAFIGLAVISTYGLLTMQQQKSHYNQLISASQKSLVDQGYAKTQTEIKDISSNFALVVQVLSNQVLFSKLITQIATIIPAQANLTALEINKEKGAIDISAITSDYQSATQVQVNLADQTNKIFSSADIVTIGCTTPSATETDINRIKYPCTVSIHALFSRDNPFLFISNSPVTTKAATP
ncbi:MAG: hypothetical protein ABIV43_03975 [Candidatus Saccharimonadales bacterium]